MTYVYSRLHAPTASVHGEWASFIRWIRDWASLRAGVSVLIPSRNEIKIPRLSIRYLSHYTIRATRLPATLLEVVITLCRKGSSWNYTTIHFIIFSLSEILIAWLLLTQLSQDECDAIEARCNESFRHDAERCTIILTCAFNDTYCETVAL